MVKKLPNVAEETAKFKIVRGIDLIKKVQEEPEPKMLWKGIPEGSTGLITGVAKTGKTTFAENLAISLAVGKKEFFGFEMDGEPKKVLFINLEESYRIRSRRNAKQISRLDEEQRKLFDENYISTPVEFPEYLNAQKDWDLLREYIIKSEAEIIFIDSLSHMLIGEIERSQVVQQFNQTFRRYLSSLNKTFIVIHHNTKGNEKPIDQDSVAGSRFVLQEFEFAHGFANIPTGGNYSCMLYNKYVEKDDTTAHLYKVSGDGWVDHLGTANKFNLYKNNNKDGRVNTSNKDLIYKYVQSQTSQDSPYVSAADLLGTFVSSDTSTKVMSKDTLYKKLSQLEDEGKIKKLGQGKYGTKEDRSSERK